MPSVVHTLPPFSRSRRRRSLLSDVFGRRHLKANVAGNRGIQNASRITQIYRVKEKIEAYLHTMIPSTAQTKRRSTIQ